MKTQNSPEREVHCVEEKPIQREVTAEKPLEREVTTEKPLEREVTAESLEIEIISDQREGSPESQVSLAQQEVANLKQVILQELESNNSDTMSQQALLTAVGRLEAVAIKLESLATKSGNSTSAASTDSDVTAPFVAAYDEILKGSLATFLQLTNQIGGDLSKMGDVVSKGFNEVRQLLVVASKSKKPADGDLVKLLQPISECISTAMNFREGNRPSPLFNHLSVLSESLPALAWVSMTPKPGPYVKDMADAGMFYSNRVLKDYKGKDDKHVQWAKSWSATLTTLQAYIKEYHTTGLSWNAQGGDAMAVGRSGSSTPSAGGPPPPPPAGVPPPPPPPPAPTPEIAGDSRDDAKAELFASLNRGTEITKGLRKVTDDMKTYKNPKLREGPPPYKVTNQGPKPYSKPSVTTPAKHAPVVVEKPPVFELQNKKWIIEYQKGNKNLVIDKTELKQTVYVFKCTDSTVTVKGKVNSIILDSCKKVGIVFDDLVSSLEFVNCQSVQGQVTGKMAIVSIDKTDGCMIYLSKDSLNCEIISSKSSEMNVLIPKDDGDYVETALPEQYKTFYDGKRFVTTCTESV